MKKGQTGFGAVAVLLVLVVISLIGFTGWYVWQTKNNKPGVDTSKSNPPMQQSENKAEVKKRNPEAGYKIRTMNAGKLTFSYPETWKIYNGSDYTAPVTDDTPEINIFSKAKEEIKNNFLITISVADGLPSQTPYDQYPNGIVTKVQNGIEIWEERMNITMATGPEEVKCPEIRIVDNKKFGHLISGMKYLNIFGSFCWGQGVSTTYSYDEIKASSEYKEALKLIQSVEFN